MITTGEDSSKIFLLHCYVFFFWLKKYHLCVKTNFRKTKRKTKQKEKQDWAFLWFLVKLLYCSPEKTREWGSPWRLWSPPPPAYVGRSPTFECRFPLGGSSLSVQEQSQLNAEAAWLPADFFVPSLLPPLCFWSSICVWKFLVCHWLFTALRVHIKRSLLGHPV